MPKASLMAGSWAALLVGMSPTIAAAQMADPTGAEIAGHPVSVNVGGVTNTIYFAPDGTARIVSPAGTEVQGNWTVANRNLCLTTSTARECWPYAAAFQAGQPVSLTSDCAVTSQWTPVSTTLPPAPAVSGRAGERG